MGVRLLLRHGIGALQNLFRPCAQTARLDLVFQFMPDLFEYAPRGSRAQHSLDVPRDGVNRIWPSPVFEEATNPLRNLGVDELGLQFRDTIDEF